MLTYWVVEVKLHAFLTSTLDGGERSAHARYFSKHVDWMEDQIPEILFNAAGKRGTGKP